MFECFLWSYFFLLKLYKIAFRIITTRSWLIFMLNIFFSETNSDDLKNSIELQQTNAKGFLRESRDSWAKFFFYLKNIFFFFSFQFVCETSSSFHLPQTTHALLWSFLDSFSFQFFGQKLDNGPHNIHMLKEAWRTYMPRGKSMWEGGPHPLPKIRVGEGQRGLSLVLSKSQRSS